MKRALKLVLFTLGAIAGIVGLFVWDTISRAGRAIEENRTRLVADIASLRARYPTRNPVGFSFEMGHDGQSEVKWVLEEDLPISTSFAEGATPKQLLDAATAVENVLHEGGYDAVTTRRGAELRFLRQLRLRFEKETYSPEDYRNFAQAIDGILALHPTVADIIDGEQFLDRRDLLDDPATFLRRRPGWKELFSWRVLIAKALVQLDDFVRDIKSDPSHIQDAPDRLARTRLLFGWNHLSDDEPQTRQEWVFMRAVVLLARFKAAYGRRATTLEEAGISADAPLEYSNGVLRMTGTLLSWAAKED